MHTDPQKFLLYKLNIRVNKILGFALHHVDIGHVTLKLNFNLITFPFNLS